MLEGKEAKEYLQELNKMFERQEKNHTRRVAITLFFATLIIGELILYVVSRLAG